MAVSDYNTTPSLNVTISGINVAEGCPAGNINGAFRQMMADIRVFYDARLDPALYVPKAGGTFTGQILRSARGGYHHNAGSADVGGAWYVIAFGASLPSGLEVGDFVAEVEA
jgi:hypothetical protein